LTVSHIYINIWGIHSSEILHSIDW